MKPTHPAHAGHETNDAGVERDSRQPDSGEFVARATPRTTQQRRRKNAAQPQPTQTTQESSAPEAAADDEEDRGTFRIYAAFAYASIFVVESIDLWLS